MNPAFRSSCAFVGALDLKLAIDSILVLGAIERIILTIVLVGTMDLSNQIGIVAPKFVTIVGIRFFMLVCGTGGILLEFFTLTVPVESFCKLSHVVVLGQIPSRNIHGQRIVVKHTRAGASVRDCSPIVRVKERKKSLMLTSSFLSSLPLSATATV